MMTGKVRPIRRGNTIATKKRKSVIRSALNRIKDTMLLPLGGQGKAKTSDDEGASSDDIVHARKETEMRETLFEYNVGHLGDRLVDCGISSLEALFAAEMTKREAQSVTADNASLALLEQARGELTYRSLFHGGGRRAYQDKSNLLDMVDTLYSNEKI